MKIKDFNKWYKKTFKDKNKWDYYDKKEKKEVKNKTLNKVVNWQSRYDNY